MTTTQLNLSISINLTKNRNFDLLHSFFSGRLAESRSPWLILFTSALLLELTALYFQYAMELKPCIMCIYQRNAVFGVMLAGLIGSLMYKHSIGRLLAFATWLVSAIWGALIAYEHVDIQQAANPFFVSCEIVPNFPSWLPLHQWIPSVFAATGDCGNIDWQFLTLSMPQWMLIILSVYAVLAVVVLAMRLLKLRRI